MSQYKFVEYTRGDVVLCYSSEYEGFFSPLDDIDEADFFNRDCPEIKGMLEKLRAFKEKDEDYYTLLDDFYNKIIEEKASDYIPHNTKVLRGVISVPYESGVMDFIWEG